MTCTREIDRERAAINPTCSSAAQSPGRARLTRDRRGPEPAGLDALRRPRIEHNLRLPGNRKPSGSSSESTSRSETVANTPLRDAKRRLETTGGTPANRLRESGYLAKTRPDRAQRKERQIVQS